MKRLCYTPGRLRIEETGLLDWQRPEGVAKSIVRARGGWESRANEEGSASICVIRVIRGRAFDEKRRRPSALPNSLIVLLHRPPYRLPQPLFPIRTVRDRRREHPELAQHLALDERPALVNAEMIERPLGEVA
jgi:hypothetical protein